MADLTPPPINLADMQPSPEANSASPGNQNLAARPDHVHPRITSAQRVTIGADGTAVVTYSRDFSAKPAITLAALNPSGRAVSLEVVSDTLVGGKYVGCVVKGYRSQLLPSLSGILLIGPLLTALGNFDVLGGSAVGVEVNVIAVQASV